MSVRDSDKTKPYLPRAGLATDGWSNDKEATATCFCGAVQLIIPVDGPGMIESFVCNCVDCHKITASMFGANLCIDDKYLKHARGQENLKKFSQSITVGTPNTMTNHFCGTCGSLMYRIGTGFPGVSILRLGTVDDFNLAETKLKPRIEQFVKDRVSWLHGAEGVRQVDGYHWA